MFLKCVGSNCCAMRLGEEDATSGPLPGLRHTQILSLGTQLKEQADKVTEYLGRAGYRGLPRPLYRQERVLVPSEGG